MSRATRVLGIILASFTIIATISSVMTGLVYLDGIRASRHTSQAFAVGPAPALTVTGAAASVTIVAGSPGQVAVEQDVSVRGITREVAARAMASMEGSASAVGGRVAVLTDHWLCCSSSAWVNDEASSWLIRLPPDGTLDIETSTGDVTVRGLSVPMRVKTDGGDVSMTGVAATGAIQVRSGAGSVTFSGTMQGGSLDISTSEGPINVTLPSNTSAHLTAATETGRLTVDPTWSVPTSNNLAAGNLGGGAGGSITLRTASGNVGMSAR